MAGAENGTMKRTKFEDGLNPIQVQRIQAMSALTSRLALSRRLGISHGGERDLYSTLGYPREVSSKEMIDTWRRNGVARAIIDRPVKKTWQGDLSINEPESEDETQLEREFDQLNERLGLKSRLLRADRLAQLGEFAVLLLGFDDSNQDTWTRPVGADDDSAERSLNYVRPVSRENVEIERYETDPSNPRFGLPRIYSIEFEWPEHAEWAGNDTQRTSELRVHHTRVVHVAFDLLENEVAGNPVMKAAYNRLKDLEKLVGGAAEMFWRGARPGYFGSAKEDFGIDSDTESDLKEQIDEYENDLRRILVSEGVDMESLEQQVADPSGHVKAQFQVISAVTGIPIRLLTGSERGEMASTQDKQNFKEFISTRRTEEVEPNILRPFVDRLIRFGVLSEPQDTDVGYSVAWSDLFTMGEKDKAEVGGKRANALANYVKQPMAEQLVPLEAFLKYFLRMDDDQVDQIVSMSEEQMEEMIEEEREAEETEEEMNEIEESEEGENEES